MTDQVERIHLDGAPTAILVDRDAMGDGAQVRRLLAALGLDVVSISSHGVTLTGPTVAVLGSDHPPVADCYAWYVGPGPTPTWMHPTAGHGPATAEQVVALLGTGFAQERAAAAFRSAGAGKPVPDSTPYDASAILHGITVAVAPWPTPGQAAPLSVTSYDDLLHASAAALDRCCAANGAIAAAPPGGDGEPDYWFFWQRDAAHAAFALHALATAGPDEHVRCAARARVEAYVTFVADLGPALAAQGAVATSRCTMSGEPVGRYGDPQHDGPAATALAVLSVVPDIATALEVARPFLQHLVAPRQAGFDCWELTVGTTFHEVNLARRALRLGARLAEAAGRGAEAAVYVEAAAHHTQRLAAFRRPEGGLFHSLRPRPAWFGSTSRLDVSAVGSVLLGYDATDQIFGVDDPDLVATVDRLEAHFSSRWPVNAAWRQAGRLGGGIGRFPEDCNDGVGSTGGNPWPVATLWASQYHLRRAERLPDAGHAEAASGYLSFALAHTDGAGMSEQVDATTGRPRGACPLAWGQAELVITLTASRQPG
jgi:hypothetical protein